MAITRPYVVIGKNGAQRLVVATNPAQAIRHVSRDQFGATAATGSDVLALMARGIQPEQADQDDAQPQPQPQPQASATE